MLIIFLKIFAVSCGVSLGVVLAIFIGSRICDRTDRDIRYKRQGYDDAIEDIIRRHLFYDRLSGHYVEVTNFEIDMSDILHPIE